MIIYRIQDKSGRGPFKPGFTDKWLDEKDYSKLTPFPLHSVANKLLPYELAGTGCFDLNSLREWFTENEYKRLLSYGYFAVKMEVNRILYKDDIQCVFTRARALRKGAVKIDLYDHTTT